MCVARCWRTGQRRWKDEKKKAGQLRSCPPGCFNEIQARTMGATRKERRENMKLSATAQLGRGSSKLRPELRWPSVSCNKNQSRPRMADSICFRFGPSYCVSCPLSCATTTVLGATLTQTESSRGGRPLVCIDPLFASGPLEKT